MRAETEEFANVPAGTGDPVQTMTFFFLRHAEKEHGVYHNARLGHQDQPISRYGRRQARRMARHFARWPLKAVFVSDYLRTLQTADPLCRRLGLVPIRDSRLNEINNGELEGLTEADIQTRYPDTWGAYQARDSDFRWPGGETGEESRGRIADFLSDQGQTRGDKLAVAHDGILRLLLCHVLGVPVYRRFSFRFSTCGFLELRRTRMGDPWTVVRFNQELSLD